MRPRKRFGQHFLVDEGVLGAIDRALALRAEDKLLEIGPGRGALTAVLHGQPGRYVAVEIDRDLAPMIERQFSGIEVINEDILRTDLSALLAGGDWRVVGNLPYNVSTPLLVKLATVASLSRDMLFMLQKEVAQRIAAGPGGRNYGRLSVLIQRVCLVEHLLDVPPQSFSPPPKVDSAVVRIKPLPEPLAVVSEAAFADVVRLAFGARRKRLSNALKSLAPDWQALGIDPGLRAEDLAVTDYVKLADAVAAAPAD